MIHKTLIQVCLCVCVSGAAVQIQAQDTVHITLHDAEKQFVDKNLSLLAEKYNIDIARAQVIQAKLYTNPNLSFTGNIYNQQNKKPFDISNKTGEYIIGIQQMIRLAGKRNKEVQLAETGTSLSEDRFFDLLRTLRYTLRSNFFNAYYLQHSIAAYNNELRSLEALNASYESLQAKGLVTLKDAIRIRSLLYSLKAEQASLQNQLNDGLAELQLLLQNNKVYLVPEINADEPISVYLEKWQLQNLVDTAFANRRDLKLSENTIRYNQQNYVLQKAMATPDLLVGGQFDKRGSFVDNASFFNLAMDLPFFHRNQGNIKAAKLSIDQSKIIYDQQKLAVENEVQRAYTKAMNTNKMLQSIDPLFKDQFEKLLLGITENFQKKNISLIEFTDFYESYKNNILQFNQLQNERMQAIEALHFAIGKTLITN